MIRQRFKGGEFYAASACKPGAMCTKRWNSSDKQHRSVVDHSMLRDVAARIIFYIRAFSFAPELPHAVLDFLNMKIPKFQL